MTNKDAQLQLLEKISASLQELVKLTRAMSHSTIRQLLQTGLDSEEKLLVYQSLDGTKSVRDIQELTGVNLGSISRWGQEWEALGIVEPSTTSAVGGRRQRSFDLATFGISVPEAAKADLEHESK